jgi:methylase of polypeptide subunit release factors
LKGGNTIFQFQTPDYVAEYMVDLIKEEPKLVLEPSIGEGNLVKALWEKYPNTQVIAYDIEDTPLQDDRLKFIKQDFLEVEIEYKPDLILSNPPFTPMELSYKFFDKLINIQPR